MFSKKYTGSYVLTTVLGVFYILSHLIFKTTIGIKIIPNLQMNNLRLREVQSVLLCFEGMLRTTAVIL